MSSENLEISLYRALTAACRKRPKSQAAAGELEATATFVFGSDFPGFQGHFPGKPILPAVVQLAAVRYAVELVLARELKPLEYRRIKFRDAVVPDEDVVIRLRIRASESGWPVDFVIEKKGKEGVADGSCLFVPVNT